jgi:hypothetical protein
MPAGATVIFGEYGRYEDQFAGLCGTPFGDDGNACVFNLATGVNNNGTAILTPTSITGSEVDRWGVGIVQEVDSAAMHLFARWQHLEVDIHGVQAFVDAEGDLVTDGTRVKGSFEDLEIFQVGGVIFF